MANGIYCPFACSISTDEVEYEWLCNGHWSNLTEAQIKDPEILDQIKSKFMYCGETHAFNPDSCDEYPVVPISTCHRCSQNDEAQRDAYLDLDEY